MSRMFSGLLAIAVALVPSLVWGQGLLVDVDSGHPFRLPRPHIHPHPGPWPQPVPELPQSYKIQELAVNATITDQVAQVQVSQSFVNTGSRQMEVVVRLPAAVRRGDRPDDVHGRRQGVSRPSCSTPKKPGDVYEEIVRQNRDPALLEWMGTGMFKTSVFPVPPGAERKVSLRYSQLCRKTEGLTDFLFPLSTAKYTSHPVEKVNGRRDDREPGRTIKNVYSPTHAIEIKRPDEQARHGHVCTAPERSAHAAISACSTTSGPGKVGAQRVELSAQRADDDGYFLLLASPGDQGRQPSGPTEDGRLRRRPLGQHERQEDRAGQGGLKFVLEQPARGRSVQHRRLRQRTSKRSGPSCRGTTTKRARRRWASSKGFTPAAARTSTGACGRRLAQLAGFQAGRTTSSSSPTACPRPAKRNEAQDRRQRQGANKVRARIFAFGVGYDVNSRLLDKLVRENLWPERIRAARRGHRGPRGQALRADWLAGPGGPEGRVRPGKLAGGKRIADQPRLSQGHVDLFAGDQLVLVGRYKQPGNAKVTIRGKVDGTEQSFNFPAKLVEKSPDDSQAFIEKLWAVRRVGEIIDEIDLHGKNEELVNELVALATRHGILTPYTSFLADENANIRDVAATQLQTGVALEGLQRESGEFAFGQRVVKSSLQRANQAPGSGYATDMRYESGYPAAMPGDAAGSVAGRRGAMAGGAVSGPQGWDARPRRAGMPGIGAMAENPAVVTTVINVGKKTFFRRQDRWEDSVLTEEQLRNLKHIERYSDEFFALSRQYGKEVAKYLALEGNVVLLLGDQAYEF